MAVDNRKKRAEKLVEAGVKEYGLLGAMTGKNNVKTEFYSSGSPTLDYMLGTGGFPNNSFVEVYGPPSIGKTTIYGYGVMHSVQEAGGLTALIATEPSVDEAWMEKHGVNPDYNVIYRPNTAEDAFNILQDRVNDRSFDYIVLDSLGGSSSQKEQNSDKPQAYGNAALNTWGIGKTMVAAWKQKVGIMIINQVRDNTRSPIPGALSSPGGHAVKHAAQIRLQVKPGSQQYKVRVPSATKDATEELVVGREIRTVIVKDKCAQELGKQAVFNFYNIETGEYPFGFDRETDLINIAKVAGVITGSGWLNNDVFPKGKINGANAAREFLANDSNAFATISKEVHEVMIKRESERSIVTPKKEEES